MYTSVWFIYGGSNCKKGDFSQVFSPMQKKMDKKLTSAI